MKYSIIGSGNVGSALARLFARKGIKVGVANSRGPGTLVRLAKQSGPGVVPQSIQDAYQAELILLAVPFPAHKAVAKGLKKWSGKLVVDVTNALDVDPKKLKGRLSSEIVSEAFAGARLVKAFNHLPIGQLGANPHRKGWQQVVFVSSNDAGASSTVAALATRLGFAPIELGRLDQGGVPLHAVKGKPGGLLSQNLEKLVGGKHE
jgi:predicted dinucleotide-binding enzyme